MPRLRPHQPIFQIDKIVGSIAPGNTPPAALEILALGYASEVDWDADFAQARWLSMMGDSGKVIVATSFDWRLVDYGTNLLAPTMTASLSQPDPGSDLAWFDSTYFLARTDNDEVSVYSASGASISSVGSLVDASYANQVFRVERISAGLVVVGGYSIGLIDVSTPASPSVAGGFTEAEVGFGLVNAMAVNAAGSLLAYVDDNDLSLVKLVDISSPASPSASGSVALSDSLTNMVIVGDRLYGVGETADEVYVVDISNPASPSQLTTFSNVSIEEAGSIAAAADTHLVTGGLDMALTDQPPTTVFTNADPPWPTIAAGSRVTDMSLSYGNLVVATGWTSGSPNEYRLRFFELLTSLGV